MKQLTLSVFGLVLLVLPSFALACTPASPYDYPIRGAYLVAFFAAAVALTFELLRFLARSETARRRLRLAAFAFALILLTGLIYASFLRSLEKEWRQGLPTLPPGTTRVDC